MPALDAPPETPDAYEQTDVTFDSADPVGKALFRIRNQLAQLEGVKAEIMSGARPLEGVEPLSIALDRARKILSRLETVQNESGAATRAHALEEAQQMETELDNALLDYRLANNN